MGVEKSAKYKQLKADLKKLQNEFDNYQKNFIAEFYNRFSQESGNYQNKMLDVRQKYISETDRS